VPTLRSIGLEPAETTCARNKRAKRKKDLAPYDTRQARTRTPLRGGGSDRRGRSGRDLGVGALHTDLRARDSPGLDLMEAIRPVVGPVGYSTRTR